MTVHLGKTKNEMLDHQIMPMAVKTLCEELVAAACLLSHMLKFDGKMILQIKGSGPITMMVAECSSEAAFDRQLSGLKLATQAPSRILLEQAI